MMRCFCVVACFGEVVFVVQQKSHVSWSASSVALLCLYVVLEVMMLCIVRVQLAMPEKDGEVHGSSLFVRLV